MFHAIKYANARISRLRFSQAQAVTLTQLIALLTLFCVERAANAATVIRTNGFDYDQATGQLVKELIEPQDVNKCVATVYTLDSYGRRSATTVRNCNGASAAVPGAPTEAASPVAGAAASFDSRGSGSTFTSDQRFVAGQTNALGHSQNFSYDGRFGLVATATDANGVVASVAYDSLGRKQVETNADGTKVKWTYVYCSNDASVAIPSGAASSTCALIPGIGGDIAPRHYIQSTPFRTDGLTVNGPYQRTYLDAVGRVIRSETQGFDGGGVARLVYVDTQYNALGQVAYKSRPYYDGDTAVWASYQYDNLGRVTSMSAPTAAGISTTVTVYSGLTTTVIAPLDRRTIERKNDIGLVESIEDARNGILRSVYDEGGRVIQTIDPAGNVTGYVYDGLGRKVAMADPDMGVWIYVYNGIGELIQQTDAKGQTTYNRYDALGRLYNSKGDDFESTWTFDTCVNGKGKLCATYAANGTQRQTTYDSRGRATNSTLTLGIAGQSTVTTYSVAVNYEAASGRLDSMSYPSGLLVGKTYTSLGYELSVKDLTHAQTLWTALDADAAGRLLQYRYGNGITTTNSYYTDGHLQISQAGPNGGVQSLNHSYDLSGNLAARVDMLTGVVAAYEYDELSRLTTETRSGLSFPGAQVIKWDFDAIGNLTTRTQEGRANVYNYPGNGLARPHAVSGISGSVNAIEAPIYNYDSNGNLLMGAGRVVAWTGFNNISSISSGRARLDYAYDVDASRIRENYYLDAALQRTTVYINPVAGAGLFFEEEVGTAGRTQKNYITADGKTVAMVTSDDTGWHTQYWHHDHLGSISVVSNESGAVAERMAYEPFGKRRYADGISDVDGTLRPANTDRGYSGHEHMDEVGLINMNGRVYDPALSRFMSADPTLQAPKNLQSYNRYSYTWNNPMRGTDPTGFRNEIDCLWDHGSGGSCEWGTQDTFLNPIKSDDSKNSSGSGIKLRISDAASSSSLSGDLSAGVILPGLTVADWNSHAPGDNGLDSNNSGLSAQFTNPAGVPFTDRAPKSLEKIRAQNPQLVKYENDIWEQSQSTWLGGLLGFGRPAHEEALVVYQHVKTGDLKYDLSYKSVFVKKTGLYNRIPMPLVVPAPADHTLLLVEHTHPWPYTFGVKGGVMQGPSVDDDKMAKSNPQAYFVVQAQPPLGGDKQYFYFGPKVSEMTKEVAK